MLLKPHNCTGCALADLGKGYAPADGPDTSPLLLVGEALGATEAAVGKPFVGDAGSMLARLFKMLGWEREHLRIDNSIRCRPPNDWLENAPWQYPALDHCAPYLNDSLASPYLQVVVPMGTTAIKRVMRVSGKKVGPNNFHGTVTRDALDRFWIVPTFHPSFLQRGAHNLIGTVLWDLQQAFKAITNPPPPDPASIVCDPPLEWFHAWVDLVIVARQQDPAAYPISSDIETPDKASGQDEGEITSDDRSFTILRWNVSCHQDEGITVPFQGPYIDELIRLHQSPGPIWGWNFTGYDFERAVASGVLKPEDFPKVLDLMWVAHQLQSDVPRGLGFWAPFYSSFGPWKHLADSEPARYAAIDGFQTHRVGFGLLRDHQKLGTWPTVARHVHQLHHQVLKPAQMVGVKVDRERLTLFKSTLSDKATTLLNKLQESYPDGLRNLTPKQGLVSRPKENVLHVKASAFTRKGKKRKGKDVTDLKLDLYRQAVVVERELRREVRCCESCGGVGVHTKHRCKDRSLVPATVLRLETVTRYFWSEPFNPDSWQQVLNYIKFKKHQPGKAKKTKKDSTDRETLDRLSRTGDPLYLTLLDYRAVIKVKGTYVEGTERRMDDEGRIHPEPTFKPSTSRLCVAEGTPIEVLRDVEAFPRGIPIEQVKVGDWAYTYDDNQHLTLRRVTWAGQTGLKRVVRVHWAGSNRRRSLGYVDLTPEHEVRLTTGEYRQAQDLHYGDRVLSLSRIPDRQKGYTLLCATGQRQPLPEHRYAYAEITGTRPGHVHHKNERKLDNRFENLVGLDVGEHFRLHNTGKGNPRWQPAWPEGKQARQRQATREWRERQRKVHNHRVLAVELRDGLVPVFDLEIDETHNFIAGEVCVHNSYINPNITNIIVRVREGRENLATGFRRCLVASPGCRLLEVDFGGSEQVDVGWYSRDPNHIRLARLGIHAGLASHVLKRPYDPSWSPEVLGAYFKEIKQAKDEKTQAVYERSKRFVHGFSYGLTIPGMVLQFPETFPNHKVAEEYADIFRSMAPKIPAWQRQVRERAFKQHYLGGPGDHPFGYKHWFWSVFTYKKITAGQYWAIVQKMKRKGIEEGDSPVAVINGQYFRINLGEDAKRCVAFYPQSTTAGKLKEAMLRLFDPEQPAYIGDVYFGKTPLRAPIHDSLLLEIPTKVFDLTASIVVQEMQRPLTMMPCPEEWQLGPYLSTGVSVKVGTDGGDWASLSTIAVTELGVGSDVLTTAAVGDEEEVADLGREVA